MPVNNYVPPQVLREQPEDAVTRGWDPRFTQTFTILNDLCTNRTRSYFDRPRDLPKTLPHGGSRKKEDTKPVFPVRTLEYHVPPAERHRPPPEKPQDDSDMERLWRKSHAMLFSKDNHVTHTDLRDYFDRERDFAALPVPPRLRRVLPLRADWKLGAEKLKVPPGMERSHSTPTARPKGCPTWKGIEVLFSAQNDTSSAGTRAYFDRPRERPGMKKDGKLPTRMPVTWKLEVDRDPKVVSETRKAAEFFQPIWRKEFT